MSTLTWCNIYSRHGYGDHPISNSSDQSLTNLHVQLAGLLAASLALDSIKWRAFGMAALWYPRPVLGRQTPLGRDRAGELRSPARPLPSLGTGPLFSHSFYWDNFPAFLPRLPGSFSRVPLTCGSDSLF